MDLKVLDLILKNITDKDIYKLETTYKSDIVVLKKNNYCDYCNEYDSWLYSIGQRGCKRHVGGLIHDYGGPVWGCCGLKYGQEVSIKGNITHGKTGCTRSDHSFGLNTSILNTGDIEKNISIPLGLLVVCKKLALKTDVLFKNILSINLIPGNDNNFSKRINLETESYYDLNKKMDDCINDNHQSVGGGYRGRIPVIFELPKHCGIEIESVNMMESKVTFSLVDC